MSAEITRAPPLQAQATGRQASCAASPCVSAAGDSLSPVTPTAGMRLRHFLRFDWRYTTRPAPILETWATQAPPASRPSRRMADAGEDIVRYPRGLFSLLGLREVRDGFERLGHIASPIEEQVANPAVIGTTSKLDMIRKATVGFGPTRIQCTDFGCRGRP